MHGIAALQAYVIGPLLLWAAMAKLLGRRARASAEQSALARLAGPGRAVHAYRLTGVLELAVAAALLAPPALPVDGLAAAALSAGFLAYLTYARVAAPASSCGCLGGHARPADPRAFARAGLLFVMSLAVIGAGPLTVTPPLAALGLAEAAVLVGLSAELDRYWLTPLRRLVVRLRGPLAAPPPGEVPLEVTLRLLYLSPAYCSASARLSSDVQDTWDEDGLRFVVYAAQGRIAVFAVPLAGGDPSAVRVALIDEPVPA
ncbi:MauE/DoxX family redox-associated membrane protein [Sphaerisporangium corydalis]|uniref:MauE/DoxX family redox-associated membrane protein n=1 Tax=Sphaerisporangium corydalis TaxID=1441875 RepID=A0ABV9EMA1_9ACTN|nr:MauE/DoxX family redox-associated membrane protein [Sphaerisporangium corydalis]